MNGFEVSNEMAWVIATHLRHDLLHRQERGRKEFSSLFQTQMFNVKAYWQTRRCFNYVTQTGGRQVKRTGDFLEGKCAETVLLYINKNHFHLGVIANHSVAAIHLGGKLSEGFYYARLRQTI